MHMIKRGISIDTTEEEEEGENEISHHAMEIEGYFEEIPLQTERIYEDPSAQNLQLQWQGENPMQEGPSSQEGPPTLFLEYF